jgi:DNA-binding MarR family transcriptional regulator
MTDVISSQRKSRARSAGRNVGARLQRVLPSMPSAADTALLQPATAQAALLQYVELLFFAYRDFTGEADAMLATFGLGRAHHRVLHFVNRQPGIRVADLLGLLKITKQSLGRVLRKLIDDGWVEQVPGRTDRRERRLTLTDSGRNLAADLAQLQTRRIDAALGAVEAANGSAARESVRGFLLALIAAEERPAVTELLRVATAPSPRRASAEKE